MKARSSTLMTQESNAFNGENEIYVHVNTEHCSSLNLNGGFRDTDNVR